MSSPRQVDEISVGFIRTEDCIQFKMAAASLMRGFSRWQFVVLGRITGFHYCKSKEQLLRNTRLLKKREISEFIAKKFLFEIVSRRNMCDRKQDLQIIT